MQISHSFKAIFYFFIFTIVSSSPFDPRPVVPDRRFSWFQGWFQRVIDHENDFSIAIIVANYQRQHSKSFTDAFISVLYTNDGRTILKQSLLDTEKVSITMDGEPIQTQPSESSPSNFTWAYLNDDKDEILLHVEDKTSTFHLKGLIPNMDFQFQATNRKPWNPSCPVECGPEGWLSFLPFKGAMPLHYYIQSLGSTVEFEFRHEDRTVKGKGLLHQEANYGEAFPVAWVWAQGATEEYQFIMTGGEFVVFGLKQMQHIVGIRGPNGMSWNFWDIDLDKIEYLERDACRGVLRASAHSTLHGHSVTISIKAAFDSFSERIFTPMPTGVAKLSQESYHATIKLEFDGKVVEIPNAALEFGGYYLCNVTENHRFHSQTFSNFEERLAQHLVADFKF